MKNTFGKTRRIFSPNYKFFISLKHEEALKTLIETSIGKGGKGNG